MDSAHNFCWVGEPCELGRPQECPKVRAHQARDLGEQWHILKLRRETSGLRHYLAGHAVHCGTALELQAVTTKSDDYGDFTHYLQRGVVVRYEAVLHGRAEDARVTLYGDLGGHEFVAQAAPWMRFRWPQGARHG